MGQKDAQMSLFSLWKEIFQLPSAKRFVLKSYSSSKMSTDAIYRRPIGFAMETVNYQGVHNELCVICF